MALKHNSTSTMQIVLVSNDTKHIYQLFSLATSITELGHHVSFVSTLSSIKAIPIDPSNTNPSNLDLVPLPGDSTTDLKEEFKRFLLRAPQEFDWVLFDLSSFWGPKVSKVFGIHSAYITFTSVVANSHWWPVICESRKPKANQFIAQETSFPMDYNSGQVSTVVNHLLLCDEQDRPLYYKIRRAILTCDVVALPSYYALDKKLPENLEQISQNKVCSFGHLPLTATNAVEDCLVDSTIIQEWLDKKGQCSVVYIAFEFEIPVSVATIAKGLERSHFPFVWVTGNQLGGQTVNPPDGFVERTKNYGLVCKHWVPHAHILSHPSIGGFLTNGDWTLCLEALDFGIPLMLAPFSTAEEPNALYIEEKGLGCMIKRHPSVGVYFSVEVERVLKHVMASQGGQEIRERVWTLRGVFSRLQNPYLMCFLNELIEIKERNAKGTTNNLYQCSYTGCIICRDEKKNAAGMVINIE